MTHASSLRFVLALVFLLPVAASAQEAVVTTAAPIFLRPDASRVPLRTAAPNSRLRVLEEAPEGWVKVEFHDPQWGNRVGYIEAKYVRIRRPELEPMDLSIGKEPPARAPGRAASPGPQPPAASAPRRLARGWIDVNFGLAVPGQARYGTVYEPILFSERATVTADYHSPAGAGFDFGGGFMFTPQLGLGISFAGTAHQDHAQLGIRIPHPFFSNAHASDSAPTDGRLMRVESGAHVHAMLVSPIFDRIALRIYAGPSYFRVRQDAVGRIRYDQVFLVFSPANAVQITGYDPVQIDFEDGAGWGFHLGGDASIFFTRIVGIGAFARFSRGNVEVLDPLSGSDLELQTGGFQAGGGLRLRF